MAQKQGNYNSRSLKVALDSSPLWGAARVEDTYNLLGHALRKALEVIAQNYQQDLATVAASAGAEIVTGTSLKAALDLDWDDPESRNLALSTILQALNCVESWVEQKTDLDLRTTLQVNKSLKDARQIEAQDVEEASDGSPKLRKAVAKDRRISIEDEDMRHGRKSRSQKIDGYKRHVLKDLELQMIRAVGITKANAPEASVTIDIESDLNAQQITLENIEELQIDRAYLVSHWVKERIPNMTIICKAWRFSCTVAMWDGEYAVRIDHLKPLNYLEPECQQMQVICDRISRLRDSGKLELIRKENLKGTQLITRSEFQRINAVLI
ncbi:MAG: hypothetical protein RM368_28260 [Nostoc sp. DedSLP03]|uniref:hypothetical protein n=1 Tax=Nostoc sp. DedSLP03 TaxID=3075400 RepID=UPI002AD3EDA9|nr:hypothetical protein [Nostoc sp. DedSLP03]MDZ7968797.1 hypothetical protein [Nostoc sp. DedSLP03]